jgi:site-specific DNA recombinase
MSSTDGAWRTCYGRKSRTPRFMHSAAACRSAWVSGTSTRRAQIVAEMREQEGRRDRLFELLETSGKDTPDLGLVSERLRQRTAELEQLQRQLVTLEAMPGPLQAAKVDPEIAAEVLREVITSSDTKKKRAFLGAFIERMTVDAKSVTVDYRPETLLSAGSTSSVRSECGWLLDLGSNQGPTD